jgi:hypothetical protein
LTREGRPVHLSPKAFRLLTILLDARPRVLSKVELQASLWPDTFVSEANLSNLIAEVRSAIGDAARSARYIRTVHGCGYAFFGVAEPARVDSRPRPGARATLAWGRIRFPLDVGEHVIGRDPATDVRLNASTVSRHHACVVVGVDGVRLSDLGSKNGTFRGEQRVTDAVDLRDGDVVRIGSLTMIVEMPVSSGTTDTAG